MRERSTWVRHSWLLGTGLLVMGTWVAKANAQEARPAPEQSAAAQNANDDEEGPPATSAPAPAASPASEPAPAQKPAAADPVLAKAAENAAAAALKTLADVKKPDNVAEDAWAKQLTQFKVFLNGVAAQAATVAKDCASAVADYKAVLALNPDDPNVRTDLGTMYLYGDDVDRAISEYQTVLAKRPDFFQAHFLTVPNAGDDAPAFRA